MSSLLVFTESYARGGGNRYVVDLTNALTGEFTDISVFTNPGGLFPEDRARLDAKAETRTISVVTRAGIAQKLSGLSGSMRRLIVLGLVIAEPFLLLWNVLRFTWLLRGTRPDCVLSCNGGYPASQACLCMVMAAHLAGIPGVLSIVSTPTPRRRGLRFYDKFVDTLVWKSAGRVIVNARMIAETLEREHDPVTCPVSVIYNGVDDVALPSAAKKGNGPVLGYVARLDRAKGIFVLLDAFTEIARRYPNLKLVLAGDGPAMVEVKSLISARGLENRVDLLGHYAGDIAELLSGFDVFVFPSLWEGFPYSVVEAMRSGRAIVATRVGGIPEAITDEKEGLLIDPGSGDDLVAAITRLADDDKLGARLGQNARKRFEDEFSVSEMHKLTRKLIRDTMAARPRRSGR